MISVLAIIAIITTTLVWWLHKRPKNFPPGPTGLPFIGYFPFLGKCVYRSLTELGLKYGSIYSVSMGMQPAWVVLNDWNAVKEALVNQADNFSGRPEMYLHNEFHQKRDLMFIDGALWKEKRHFALHHLKNLGFGKYSMEDTIGNEVAELVSSIDSYAGDKVPIVDLLFLPLLNITWILVAGKRYTMDDHVMVRFSHILKFLFGNALDCAPLAIIPQLRFLPCKASRAFKVIKEGSEEIDQFLKVELADHIKMYSSDTQRDFIDIYLAEIFRQRKLNKHSAAFQEEQLLGMIKDFFGAGVETNLHTLSFSFLYMATWHEIQDKVQRELDDVIGRGRSPVYSDRTLLTYLKAVQWEVHRYASITPISVLHRNHKATELLGYTVPKGTSILQNIWAVHRDPKYWDDPDIFRPERFLNAEGKLQKPEYLIPFSIGSRSCIGESLARMVLFLMFAKVLQRYSIYLPTGEKPPSLEPIMSVALRPKPFKLVFKNRF